MKPQETDCFGPTNSHPSLANHLVESENYPYLAHPFPQQSMDDPDLANPHPSLANHLVESEDHSYLAQPYPQLSMDDPNLTNPYPSLANHLVESENCSYLADPYLQQAMDGSGATNTSVSSSSWFILSAATASGSEPQATVDSCDDLQASVSSSYPAGYPYHHSSFSTKVPDEVLYTSGHSGRSQISPSAEASPHTSGSAHTDEVTVARFLKVWEDGPHSSFHLGDPVPQGFDIIASMQLTQNNCQ